MKSYKSKIVSLATIVALGLSLSACGGGGGSSDNSNDSEIKTVSMSGLVVDGYLEKAKVCLDKNYNKQCDSGEPYTLSSSTGTYTLKVDTADKAAYPVVVEVIAGQTIDKDSGSAVDKSFVMTSPKDKYQVISPITTLIKGQMDKDSDLTSTQAAELLKAKLGTTTSNELFDDYVGVNNVSSAKLHKVAQATAKLIVEIEDKIKTDLGLTTITDAQRSGLIYLVNDIVFSNIAIIATKINADVDADVSDDITTIKTAVAKTSDDLDNATKDSKTIFKLLAGKTIYGRIGNRAGTLEKNTFNADMTTIHGEELVGGNDNWADTITDITSNTISTTEIGGDETGTITILQIYDDYVLFNYKSNDGDDITGRAYFDINKAKTYSGITSPTHPTSSSLHKTWRGTGMSGNEFAYLTLMSDGKFVYGEYDSSATESGENGVENGTYTYNSSTGIISITATYDDNTATGGTSGFGTIGQIETYQLSMSNGNLIIHTDDGNFELEKVTFTPNTYEGVWNWSGANAANSEFAYLIINSNGTFFYGENDSNTLEDTENGLEYGTYSYNSTNHNMTFTATYDDNTATGIEPHSGISTIGTPLTFTISLSNSNNTLELTEGGDTFSLSRVY